MTQTMQQHPAVNILPHNGRATVVSIYGVPASGKSYLLRQVRALLDEEKFFFFEGSERIARLVNGLGGLDAFRRMDPLEQTQLRELAISDIRSDCLASGRIGVVAGHFMFWKEGHDEAETIVTQRDLQVYTHILYLHIPANVVALRSKTDASRLRGEVSPEHIGKWQEAEVAVLRRLCRDDNILWRRQGQRPLIFVARWKHISILHP